MVQPGAPPRTFVIAEAGVNHNGNVDLARRLVEAAVRAGADAVKFQSFRAETLVRRNALKAGYQVASTGSTEGQYAMLRRLELSEQAHVDLAAQCRDAGILFLSTPFDEASADLLDRLGVPLFKVPSGEITNAILLRHVGGKKKPVILSTGMSMPDEVATGMEVLRAAGAPQITLLHCVSDYPTAPEHVNLRVMETLRRRFNVPVGLSDHTAGIAVPMAAAALGAAVIEKHFTLDRTLPGPDHPASLEPEELERMVAGIREVERALGDGTKTLTPAERETVKVIRRSLVAARDLPAGALLRGVDVAAKRPAGGLSPMDLDRILGRRLRRPVLRDQDIRLEDLE